MAAIACVPFWLHSRSGTGPRRIFDVIGGRKIISTAPKAARYGTPRSFDDHISPAGSRTSSRPVWIAELRRAAVRAGHRTGEKLTNAAIVTSVRRSFRLINPRLSPISDGENVRYWSARGPFFLQFRLLSASTRPGSGEVESERCIPPWAGINIVRQRLARGKK